MSMFPDERVGNRNDPVSYIAYKVSHLLEHHKLGEMNLTTCVENASGYIALHHHCCCIPPVDMCAGSKSLLVSCIVCMVYHWHFCQRRLHEDIPVVAVVDNYCNWDLVSCVGSNIDLDGCTACKGLQSFYMFQRFPIESD